MLDKNNKVEMLKQMYRIRFFEEHSKKLYKKKFLEGSFMGALHTYIGQEAIAVGICFSLIKDDYVFSSHRGHGHFIAKGGSLKEMMAELRGKKNGCSGGMGGSMHLFSTEIGFMGGNGIVGAGIPLSIGAAFSAAYRDSKQVSVCFFGDGAANQGTFHESLNIASLWQLPVIFVCENNCYAVTSEVSKTICVPDISIRAAGYGIPGKVLNGNDVLNVYEEAQEAIKRAREGGGPTLFECKTYRIDPHCMVIAENRSEEEIKKWRQKDPILLFERHLEEKNLANTEDFEEIKKNITLEIEEAEEFAEMSSLPDKEEFRRFIHNEI